MEDANHSETHLTSAAAFVEGGILESSDDACSICLEAFSDSDPSTVTSCKHEFHLHCILEWCKRSSQCPMCWQSISLKDSTSQELLEGVEQERSFRLKPSRTAAIFHHPTLGDFELQHLPVGANDDELDEHIIQHLAAAAAMGRAHHIARREGQRSRSSTQGRPQVLLFPSYLNTRVAGPASTSSVQIGEGEPAPAITVVGSSSAPTLVDVSSQLITPPSAQAEICVSASEPRNLASSPHGNSFNDCSPNQSSSSSQDRGGPSESQSFSESLKFRFNAMSMRYKNSISKSTKGWKERLFSRNTAMTDISSEVKGEANAGIATVSYMVEPSETQNASRTNADSMASSLEDSPIAEMNNQQISETGDNIYLGNIDSQAACRAGSGSN